MFGWELPPYNSGGLGTASLGMTQGLAALDMDIDFVVPKAHGRFPFDHMRILGADQVEGDATFPAFVTLSVAEQTRLLSTVGYGYQLKMGADGTPTFDYSNPTAFGAPPEMQAAWYANRAAAIAKATSFDVVHCHDWMTYHSGIAARQVASQRGEASPFVAHVHATEMDRGGVNSGNQAIVDIEREGLQAADRVIAVSHYTKKMVARHYDVSPSKISVVHNGIIPSEPEKFDFHALKKRYKLVLSMGRITMQKGPEFFLQLAKKVTDQDPSVKFLLVGSGDMERRCIEMGARMGLTGKVLYSSFLRGSDVNRAYQMADLFVMPSVSEPFGLVALEALQNGTPAIVSKQSGVAEVSANLIKVDFWDIDKMAAAVHQVLRDPHYAQGLLHGGMQDLRNLGWDKSAEKIVGIYQELVTAFQPALASA